MIYLFSSPKFGAKVHYIDNLSHLARVVPLNQINIPPAVYQYVKPFFFVPGSYAIYHDVTALSIMS